MNAVVEDLSFKRIENYSGTEASRVQDHWPLYVEITQELLDNADSAFLTVDKDKGITFFCKEGYAFYIPMNQYDRYLNAHIYKLVKAGE